MLVYIHSLASPKLSDTLNILATVQGIYFNSAIRPSRLFRIPLHIFLIAGVATLKVLTVTAVEWPLRAAFFKPGTVFALNSLYINEHYPLFPARPRLFFPMAWPKLRSASVS